MNFFGGRRMNFFELLEAMQYRTKQYHGTGIENVKKIVGGRQGLQTNRPRTTTGWGTGGIYLTPNIKLAARYALGGLSTAPINRTPAILEIELSNQRRHNTRMRSDPLDRADTAWSDHYQDDYPAEKEAVSEIEHDVEEFIKTVAKRYKLQPGYFHINFGYELAQLQGFELHQYVQAFVAKIAGAAYNQIRNDVSRFLNSGPLAPGSTYADGKLEVTNSGTLQLTPEYWHGQHQNLYTKNIPHPAVKAVWVRRKDLPNAVGQEKQFGAELLPSEVVDRYEEEKDRYEHIGKNASHIVDAFLKDPENNDKDYAAGELEGLKEDIDDDKIVSLIDELIRGLGQEEFDFDPILNKLKERGMERSNYLDDYTGNPVEIEKDTVWVRVDPKDVASLL